ncbi:MAG: C4-type zinc ribbon domain-containing protein [Thermoanaerobaculia bacterium]
MLDKLWELQEIMSSLADKQQALENKPEGFAAVDAEYQQANDAIAQANEQLAELGKERRGIESDLQDAQEKLKKYEGQLMQVKNQQQYAAAWKEIDTARKEVKSLEEALLKKMSDIEEIEAGLAERRGSYEDLKQRFEAAYQEWQGSLGDLRQQIQTIEEKAAKVEAQIPDRLRSEFHRIFKQRQGIAVAAVAEGACSVCRFRVRSQAQQQLRRGEIVFCEGCRRIIYMERVAS